MIFVNQNYLEFLEKLKNIAYNIPIILVVNKLSKLINIPFNICGVFYIDDNAWHTAGDLDNKIIDDIEGLSTTHLVLVAGGAFSCTLIHKIWQQNQNHILLDIGSTLDPFLFGQNTRQYHKRLDKCM